MSRPCGRVKAGETPDIVLRIASPAVMVLMEATTVAGWAGMSACYRRQVDEPITARGGDGLQRDAAGALDGPRVVLLEQDRAHEAGDGSLFGKMPTTPVRRLVSPLGRSSGFVLCSSARCWTGKVM